jgi:hypothetical protein
MDNGDPIRRDMGVGIRNRGLSVGSPPRMRDTSATLNWCRLQRILKSSNPTLTLVKLQISVAIDKRNSRRVITAIFKPPETLQENLCAVPARRYRNDAAH